MDDVEFTTWTRVGSASRENTRAVTNGLPREIRGDPAGWLSRGLRRLTVLPGPVTKLLSSLGKWAVSSPLIDAAGESRGYELFSDVAGFDFSLLLGKILGDDCATGCSTPVSRLARANPEEKGRLSDVPPFRVNRVDSRRSKFALSRRW